MGQLEDLLFNISRCDLCKDSLPYAANPVLRISSSATILIIGQAPGTKAHRSNTPWNDRSGDRLRSWLNLSREEFYNQNKIAIMPMGFCYPGKNKKVGDKPPRRECAPMWHNSVRSLMPNIQLTLLVGSYAQRYYLKNQMKYSLTEVVKSWKEYLPDFFPLPHPSWRNTAWIKKNLWFETDLIPELQSLINKILHL